MASTLTHSTTVSVASSLSNALDIGSAQYAIQKAYPSSLTNGTGAGQADRIFTDTRTITASGTDDLDLAGVLIDAVGQTVTLARVKCMIVSAAVANTNNVIVGGAAATQFLSWVGGAAHTVTLRPGATLALFAGAADAIGYVTAAGASDLLRIANSGAGTSVTYDIIIVGATA